MQPIRTTRTDREAVRRHELGLELERAGSDPSLDHAERERIAQTCDLLGCERASRNLRGLNARRPFGSGGGAKLEAVPETGKPTLRSGSDRPLLTVVDGEGDGQEAQAISPTDAWWRDVRHLVGKHEDGLSLTARLVRDAVADSVPPQAR